MKKYAPLSFLVFGLLLNTTCGSSPAATVEGLLSLDEAVSGAAAAVEAKVPGGTEIAIAKIDAPLDVLSTFLNEELSDRFDTGGTLILLARGHALQSVNNEHQFQMSGMVDDASAVGIGHYLGAKVVITGTFNRFANFSQFRLRAIEVKTSRVMAAYSSRITNTDVVLADVTALLANVAVTRITENALTALNRGKDRYAEGKLDGAIREFDRALAINNDLSEGYFYRGLAYAGKGDMDKAIADYTVALRINPNLAEALNNRGNAHADSGDPDKAIADYTATLRINPNLAGTLYNRGGAYYNNGDPDRAIADWTAALRINPNIAEALYNRGVAYADSGDPDKAIADWTAALRIDPNKDEALYNRGIAYYNKGDTDRAIADYTAALRINPDFDQALYNRGVTYANNGDLDKAIADWEAVLRINPNQADAKQNLEVVRRMRGR
ncbi:hypothetical protein FACS189494_05750 [Spirochaetia bacterium]|nr:hypothetical protein FACS189494_05750 [Spirochaetia bacterium]